MFCCKIPPFSLKFRQLASRFPNFRTDGGAGAVKFMTNFPKKVFSDEEYENSLENLGLVPSAVLMVTK